MAWQLPYRPNRLHYAVSAALLCSMGSAILLPAAMAATIGKTTITSAQHEPLVAIISISDIESSDFSANLANPKVYKQLGLTPTDAMSVSFIPTSASTGQLMISTSQPVSKPFADVVLAINDNGQRNTVPKTLLMPLGSAQPAKRSERVKSAKPIVARAPKPNLPVISAPTVTSPVTKAPIVATSSTKPLAVKREAPPPLFAPSSSAANSGTINTANSKNSSALPIARVAAAPNLPLAPASRFDLETTANPAPSMAKTNTLDIKNNRRVSSRPTQPSPPNGDIPINASAKALQPIPNRNETAISVEDINSVEDVKSVEKLKSVEGLVKASTSVASADAATNVQQTLLAQTSANNRTQNDKPSLENKTAKTSSTNSNTLNIQVSRQITVRNSPINKVDSTDSPTLALSFDESMASLNSDDTAKLNSQVADHLATAADSASASTISARRETAATDSLPVANEKMVSYTVQRNDNLWLISKQIAEQNNLDISAVMSQIKTQNPNAFINQDADQLKANAELRLPNYEVIPSQSSIQAAISEQRARYLRANKKTAKASSKKATADNTTSVASVSSQIAQAKPTKSANSTAKPTTRTLPQARFSVVAPGGKGQADGTQTKADAAAGNGLSTEVLASLKSSRQRTATQAQRTKLMNNSLGSYTQKLQLQNQKLAELEARLKKLRNQ
ncbi:peptigoglycan-binding protein LysM [uncultured Psychrobacter sp.]|uniref:FimV/HubP-related protein n=1 Tax=uncultured Psychrobacter sp. TaxID=259303 RepID=UPI00260E0DF4|nr:peptigoglycan-binding protein LysM [uncultured Psychrobacter sp.]